MASELWRVDATRFFLYIDAHHKREIRNIKRSKPHWKIVATYTKNDKLLGLQYQVPDVDYRKGKRIESRINKSEE